MRLFTLLLAAAFFGALAVADVEDALRPDGWSKKRSSDATDFSSPSGKERLTVRYWDDVSDPKFAAETTIGAAGGRARDCVSEAGGAVFVCNTAFSAQGNDFRATAYAAAYEGGVVTAIYLGLASVARASQHPDETGERMAALVSSDAGSPSRPLAPPPPVAAPEPAAPPPVAGAIERVLFDLSYSYGVGGAIYPKYSPMYLFKGGGACNCADIAPGDVDLTALRRTRPEDVGRWRKAGGEYVVTYEDGDTDELDPDVGPPAPLPGGRIVGRFSALSGGGNTALGGNTIVVASEDYDFRADGTFYQEQFGGGFNDTVSAGSSRGTVGRWRIDGGTLTLSYPGGETVRTSIYWSSNGDMVRGIPDAVWIGGKGYVLED
ncbi:MAG: lipocalin family protein [Pseudomonadota bacterium]